MRIRLFVSEAIHLVLGEGDDVPGAHGFRRACVNWRYAHGWSLKEVAKLLDDTESVVDASYVDRRWQNTYQDKRKDRPKGDRPPVPLVRSNGLRHARHPEKRHAAAPANPKGAAHFLGEKWSGPGRIRTGGEQIKSLSP